MIDELDRNSQPIFEKLSSLEQQLRNRVRGQPEVIIRLTEAIQRRETDVIPQRGPRDAFLFAGPTGVGKTFLAERLAELLFGREHFERFDCSEFKSLEKYDELFGSRFGDAGRLAQAFARAPEGVWLFDEIEKAHPDFVHLFLQAVSAARLTPANGETLDLSRLYLIVTTNLGSAAIVGREHLPFSSIENHVGRAVEGWLRPELRGRFGKPYVFRPLSREALEHIAQDILDEIVAWNRARGRNVAVAPEVIPFLLCRGYSRRLGARPLLQVIEELVGNALKDDRLKGGSGSGTLIVAGNQIKLVR
jgi:ATP-dependent Clp protease ATP-binding subunit ClpA